MASYKSSLDPLEWKWMLAPGGTGIASMVPVSAFATTTVGTPGA